MAQSMLNKIPLSRAAEAGDDRDPRLDAPSAVYIQPGVHLAHAGDDG